MDKNSAKSKFLDVLERFIFFFDLSKRNRIKPVEGKLMNDSSNVIFAVQLSAQLAIYQHQYLCLSVFDVIKCNENMNTCDIMTIKLNGIYWSSLFTSIN